MTLVWTTPAGAETHGSIERITLKVWTTSLDSHSKRLCEIALRAGNLDEANAWLTGHATIRRL